MELRLAARSLGLIFLGLYAHYWVLLNVSGFRSPGSALLCMLTTRSLLAHPYLHVNIFQVSPPARLSVLGRERGIHSSTFHPKLSVGYQVKNLLLFNTGYHSHVDGGWKI